MHVLAHVYPPQDCFTFACAHTVRAYAYMHVETPPLGGLGLGTDTILHNQSNLDPAGVLSILPPFVDRRHLLFNEELFNNKQVLCNKSPRRSLRTLQKLL